MTAIKSVRVIATSSLLRDLATTLETRGLPHNNPAAAKATLELHNTAADLLKAIRDGTPTCLHCGTPLTRQRRASGWESPANLAKRTYCNPTCSGAHHSALAKAAREEQSTRACVQCGGTIIKRRKETTTAYEERRFCSRSCSTTHRHANQPRQQREEQIAKARRTRAANRPPQPAAKPAPDRPRKYRGEFDTGPLAPVVTQPADLARKHEPVRLATLGEPCAHHPTERVNAWGQCPACTAGERWATEQRRVTTRPHRDGGR